MTITVIGRIADQLGHCQWADDAIEIIPASGYRSSQPSCIPLDLDHDGQAIGEVIALEERDGALWAVATSDVDDLVSLDGPIYFSPLVRHRNGHDAALLAVGLTFDTAAVGQLPVTFLAGEPADAALELRMSGIRDLVEHASGRRDRTTPIMIRRPIPRAGPEWRSTAPAGEVEWARGGHVIEVR